LQPLSIADRVAAMEIPQFVSKPGNLDEDQVLLISRISTESARLNRCGMALMSIRIGGASSSPAMGCTGLGKTLSFGKY
jgi:hypothetical protein